MSEILNLQPKLLWQHFENLNAVPRPSKKEEKVIAFIRHFGENLALDTSVDHIGNVIIKKPATPGMEGRKTIVLQSHLDMVHQKNSETDFDFEKEGINMYVDGDWVKAKGTTLGADNGIGVASIMALLSSNDVAHPNLEALFTIDEETGMTGANELKGSLLQGDILLNLDTEDDKELCIGCAGGIDVSARGDYEEVPIESGVETFRVKLSGLTGGHSGMDIHLGRGNANKLMNRLLKKLNENFEIQIIGIDGGGLRNAIPRESFASIAFHPSSFPAIDKSVSEYLETIKNEYHSTDPALTIELEKFNTDGKALSKGFTKRFLNTIYACHIGIYRMSPDIPDLVQTSNNLARVLVQNGKFTIQCLTRSSVDSEKYDLAESLRSTFELIGAEVEFAGSYPGWTPKPDAEIVKLMEKIYSAKFNEEPLVNACHAGLECGILGKNYPNMEMISFGPNIRGAHSPDEKVQISSVQKFWELLLETLNNIPLKN